MKHFVLYFTIVIFALKVHGQQQDSLEMMIGQMIMIGIGDFNKLDKSAPIYQSIASGKVGGIILFEKNIATENTKKQLKEVISYGQKCSPIKLLVSIDEEGGKVNRLKPKYGFSKTVSAMHLGNLDDVDSTYRSALITASTLSEVGFNLNYAPVLDLNINTENPVIGKLGRSYSGNPKTVSRHASAVIQAHDRMKVLTALKHFPGHGSSEKDTHLGIADVSSSWQVEELYPYKTLIDSGLARIIMTAHIVNEVIAPDKLPGTLSYQTVTGLLRGFLDYDGVVVSDDMQMGAISKEYGLNEAIKLSINAGVDIVMFANNVPDSQVVTAEEVFDLILSAVKSGDIPQERIIESYERILKLKKTIL